MRSLLIVLIIIASTFSLQATEVNIEIESVQRNQNKNLGYEVLIELVYKAESLESGFLYSYTFDNFRKLILPSTLGTYDKKKLIKSGLAHHFSISSKKVEEAKKSFYKEGLKENKKLILYKINVIFVEEKFTHKPGNLIFATAPINGVLDRILFFSNTKEEGTNPDIFKLQSSLR
jgi:hypothetical protein